MSKTTHGFENRFYPNYKQRRFVSERNYHLCQENQKRYFLMFNVLEETDDSPIRAMIANFDCLENVGIKKPIQLLFHLKINNNDDLHYLKTYLSSAV